MRLGHDKILSEFFSTPPQSVTFVIRLPALRTAILGSSHSLHLADVVESSLTDSAKIKNPSEGMGSLFLVGSVRLELTTSCLKGKRSNHLSYDPKL